MATPASCILDRCRYAHSVEDLSTPAGAVQALAFTLPRRSPACLPRLSDEQLLDILRHSRGRYGTTLDYLLQTSAALEAHGIADQDVKRLVALARRHGLVT